MKIPTNRAPKKSVVVPCKPCNVKELLTPADIEFLENLYAKFSMPRAQNTPLFTKDELTRIAEMYKRSGEAVLTACDEIRERFASKNNV